MTKPQYRRWRPPIDTPLIDLHGCYDDFSATHGFAERLATELVKDDADPILADALTTAVFIRYCRSFTTGSRQRLYAEKFTGLSFAERSLHDRLQEVRNCHIVHPVNLQESHALYVGSDNVESASCAVVSISACSCKDLSLTVSDAEAVAALCQRWLDWLRPQIEAECKRLGPIAQQLTYADLLALPTREIEPSQNPRANRRQSRSKRLGNDAKSFSDSGL